MNDSLADSAWSELPPASAHLGLPAGIEARELCLEKPKMLRWPSCSILDPAAQLEVARRFEEALQVELDTQPGRERRIVAALHAARRRLGRSPSIREYEAMRREHPEVGMARPALDHALAWVLAGTRRWSGCASSPCRRET